MKLPLRAQVPTAPMKRHNGPSPEGPREREAAACAVGLRMASVRYLSVSLRCADQSSDLINMGCLKVIMARTSAAARPRIPSDPIS